MDKVKKFVRTCRNYDHHNFTGTIIGVNNNVTAHLNCDNCWDKNDYKCYLKKEESNFEMDIFTGYKYQCVEYARRWLIVNKKCLFGDIGCAYEIFDKINYAECLKTGLKKVMSSFANKNESPPMFGDLIIFPIRFMQKYGHVGIITDVNIDLGYVEISEQNFINYWEEPNSYSRRVILIKHQNLYTITEKRWKKSILEDLKSISVIEELIKREKSKIIGWKRIS